MAKKKIKKAKKKRAKRLPKTIPAWIPVDVWVDRGKVHAAVYENSDIGKKPNAKEQERARKEVAEFNAHSSAAHVVWVEALLPVPEPPNSPTVKGTVG